MRRVLYVIPNGHLGGAERVCELLVKHHDRKKFLPLAAFLRNGPLIEKFKSYGIEVLEFPTVRLRSLHKHHSLIKSLSAAMLDKKIDLVHSSMSYAHFFAGRAANKAHIKNVWFQHGPVGGLDRWMSLVKTSCIFTNSELTAGHQKKIMLRHFPMVPIPLGTEIPTLSFTERQSLRKSYRDRLGLKEDDIVIGAVGRLQSWKGQVELLKAFSLASHAAPGLKAVVVGSSDIGDSSYEKLLHATVDKLGLNGKAHFTGFADDMMEVYSGIDILAHTSLVPEPFGLTIIEAMSHGVPAIASKGGGLTSTGNSPSLVQADPKDTSNLAQAMVELATNPLQRQDLGEKGRQFVIANHSAAKFVQAMEEQYESLLRES